MRRTKLNHSILFSSLLGLTLPALAAPANESAMGPIVIRADRDPAQIGEVATEQDAGAYTVIRREQFAHRNASVAEIIESETGVQVRQSGGLGSYSSVSLRGASEQQVMVFVDGLPL
ncbi:MAG: TonB-dependent receptor, partial [Nevskiales bacterium]